MTPGTEHFRLRFESYELDSETGELSRKGYRLRLQDQPARLLLLLASRPGQLVTRSEIRDALWPAGEFVEFEHAINTAMRKIRAVLEDDAEKPRLIETVPRKGYRFIAPVDIAGLGPATAVKAPAPDAPATAIPQTEADRAAAPATASESDAVLRGSHARAIFLFIQIGYLSMYCAALLYSSELDMALTRTGLTPVWLTEPLTIVVAMCGIAVRLYLLSSVGMRHPAAGRQFQRLFPFVFVLDEVWAASPLLVAAAIGAGPALAGVSGLAYLPFSQKTLMRSIYPA
jgi:DNA-binding winged helix-turn-helix (wHTH) protein